MLADKKIVRKMWCYIALVTSMKTSLIDSQSFTKNRCNLQPNAWPQKLPHHHSAKLIKGIDTMTNLMQEWTHK